MFRRDKDNKLDNEGLRRMREAIRQRLDQDEPAPAPAEATQEQPYHQPAPTNEGAYTMATATTAPYDSFQGEAGYSFRQGPQEDRSNAVTEPAFAPPAAAEVQEWERDEGAPAGPVVTTVGADTTWQGTLRSTADIRIDGALDGEIETEQGLYVTADATVNATVRATTIVVAGDLKGQINCHERLEVLSSGRVSGQIDAGAIVVHEGAFLGGQLRMKGQDEDNAPAGHGQDDGSRPMLQRVR